MPRINRRDLPPSYWTLILWAIWVSSLEVRGQLFCYLKVVITLGSVGVRGLGLI